MQTTRGGLFTHTIEGKALSKGLRPTDTKARNSEWLVTSEGAIGRDAVLKALEDLSASRIDTTSSITMGHPYPQLFMFKDFIVVCGRNQIYEFDGSSLTLKLGDIPSGQLWSAGDFFDFLYMSNCTVCVKRDPTSGVYSMTTDYPGATAICDYNGQVVISPCKNYVEPVVNYSLFVSCNCGYNIARLDPDDFSTELGPITLCIGYQNAVDEDYFYVLCADTDSVKQLSKDTLDIVNSYTIPKYEHYSVAVDANYVYVGYWDTYPVITAGIIVLNKDLEVVTTYKSVDAYWPTTRIRGLAIDDDYIYMAINPQIGDKVVQKRLKSNMAFVDQITGFNDPWSPIVTPSHLYVLNAASVLKYNKNNLSLIASLDLSAYQTFPGKGPTYGTFDDDYLYVAFHNSGINTPRTDYIIKIDISTFTVSETFEFSDVMSLAIVSDYQL